MNSYSAFRKSIDRIRGVTHTLDTHVSVDRLKLKKQIRHFLSSSKEEIFRVL